MEQVSYFLPVFSPKIFGGSQFYLLLWIVIQLTSEDNISQIGDSKTLKALMIHFCIMTLLILLDVIYSFAPQRKRILEK